MYLKLSQAVARAWQKQGNTKHVTPIDIMLMYRRLEGFVVGNGGRHMEIEQIIPGQ